MLETVIKLKSIQLFLCDSYLWYCTLLRCLLTSIFCLLFFVLAHDSIISILPSTHYSNFFSPQLLPEPQPMCLPLEIISSTPNPESIPASTWCLCASMKWWGCMSWIDVLACFDAASVAEKLYCYLLYHEIVHFHYHVHSATPELRLRHPPPVSRPRPIVVRII